MTFEEAHDTRLPWRCGKKLDWVNVRSSLQVGPMILRDSKTFEDENGRWKAFVRTIKVIYAENPHFFCFMANIGPFSGILHRRAKAATYPDRRAARRKGKCHRVCEQGFTKRGHHVRAYRG